jgi:hypothetical protein
MWAKRTMGLATCRHLRSAPHKSQDTAELRG